MPREKKQSKAKKFRASSDSDLISQTESEHSNTSEPSSPRKKHKKTAAKKAAAPRGNSTPDIPPAHLPPQPLIHAGHISAANPFDDTPRSAPPQQQQLPPPPLHQQQQQLPPPQPLPRANHPGYMARHMGNPRAPNAGPFHPGLLNSGGVGGGYPRGMPPGAMGMGGYPPGPPQGPLNGPMHPPPPLPPHSVFMGNQPPQQGPPLFVCGLCRREVHETEEAILCESGCNAWFHRLCAGLSEPAFSLLTAERLAEWACDRCIREKKIPLVRMKPQPVM